MFFKLLTGAIYWWKVTFSQVLNVISILGWAMTIVFFHSKQLSTFLYKRKHTAKNFRKCEKEKRRVFCKIPETNHFFTNYNFRWKVTLLKIKKAHKNMQTCNSSQCETWQENMAIFLQINCLVKMEFARTWAGRKVISFSHSTFQNKCEEWTIISFNTEHFQCQNEVS